MDALIIKPEKSSEDATAASDAAASLQQFLANSGTLMQFLPASSDGSTQNSGSLPSWMPYQMMVLPQSFLTAQNVAGMTQDANILLAASGDMQGMKVEKPGNATGAQSVAALLQKRDSGATVTQQQVAAQLAAAVSAAMPDGMTQSPRPQAAASAGAGDGNSLKPPKKPLTPYMTFSKMIWPQVKAAHPHLSSVCELGAVVGSLWRDLDPVEKQQYNEQFTRDKWVYDEELRSYLKATGLTASDLVKPKVKRPSRPSTSQSHAPATPKPSAHTAATTSNGTAGFATTGQQLVESLLGSQLANGAGSSTAADGWNGQAAQQLLAQLGLSGQTLYANADGTISVDGSLLTIGGRPVQLATSQIAAAASDQAQQLVENVATSTAGWAWHQPTSNAVSSATSTASQQANDAAAAASNMVLYQLLANGGNAMVSDGNAAAGNAAPQVYYSVDAYGQLVAHEAKATNESNLQQQIVALRRALDEKTREADSLRSQLTEVYSNIERYNKANGNGEGHSSAAGNNGLEDGRNGSSPSDASESRKAE